MEIRQIFSGGEFETRVGYSRAVVACGFLYISGCVGVDPETGHVPARTADQCALALGNVESALTKAGASFENVIRVMYMLPDAAEFETCWPLLRAAFGANPPAATMIECGLIEPKYRIEIEVTALVG